MKKAILFIPILLLTNCIFYDFGVYLNKKALTPDDYSYYKAGLCNGDINPIKTNGVYLKYFKQSTYEGYQFYRFFPTGQIYISYIYLEPVKFETLNHLDTTRLKGYFYVENNKINIEMFSPPRRLWVYEEAFILNETIHIKSSEAKGYEKETLNDQYIFFQVDSLNSKPFW